MKITIEPDNEFINAVADCVIRKTNPDKIQKPMFYKVEEVAKILKKSSQTIRKYISDGLLGAIKEGKYLLISQEQLDEYLYNRNI